MQFQFVLEASNQEDELNKVMQESRMNAEVLAQESQILGDIRQLLAGNYFSH